LEISSLKLLPKVQQKATNFKQKHSKLFLHLVLYCLKYNIYTIKKASTRTNSTHYLDRTDTGQKELPIKKIESAPPPVLVKRNENNDL